MHEARIMLCKKQRKRLGWLLLFVLLTFVVWVATGRAAPATSTTIGDWVRPQPIPGYGPETDSPVLVADQDQTVHAFSSQWVGEELAVTYSQWTPERGWTIPVDILLPTFKSQARVTSVVLDEDGIFHTVFFSGDDIEANSYYTQAPAVHAGRATAWSSPVNIGPNTITPIVADVVLLQGGELVFVYSSRLQGQGLYVAYSFNKGETWSVPEPLFLTYDNELWPTPLELYEDSNGRLHAIWGLVDHTGNRLALYYARLNGLEEQWTAPTLFAEAIDFEANTPAIIEYEEQLIVVYNNNRPTTRWTRGSSDGGDTWTDPVRVSGHVGTNGPPSLVKDDHGVLYMFFGNRIGNPPIHGVWYTTWQAGIQRWREPEAVISGPRVQGAIGGNGFDPTSVQATLVQGNIFLLTWVTDSGAGRNGVWYTYTGIDTPALPRQPLPRPAPTPMPTPLPVDEPPIIDGSGLEAEPNFEQETELYEVNQGSYARILLVSTLPAGLFVILMLGILAVRIRHRK
jgi:hypothetical protein